MTKLILGIAALLLVAPGAFAQGRHGGHGGYGGWTANGGHFVVSPTHGGHYGGYHGGGGYWRGSGWGVSVGVNVGGGGYVVAGFGNGGYVSGCAPVVVAPVAVAPVAVATVATSPAAVVTQPAPATVTLPPNMFVAGNELYQITSTGITMPVR